jgi:hypothetical protein
MDTDKIIDALIVLGVEGPAVAVDVLRAANIDLPPQDLAEVMNKLVLQQRGQANGA